MRGLYHTLGGKAKKPCKALSGFGSMRIDRGFELIRPILVRLEHIEACASRGEEDRVSGLCMVDGFLHGPIHGIGDDARDAFLPEDP